MKFFRNCQGCKTCKKVVKMKKKKMLKKCKIVRNCPLDQKLSKQKLIKIQNNLNCQKLQKLEQILKIGKKLYDLMKLGKAAKKGPFSQSFTMNGGGGGVSRKVKRLWSYFLHHVFVGVFQCVPGPPKHVLHLVWSAYVISTAVRTASKVA